MVSTYSKYPGHIIAVGRNGEFMRYEYVYNNIGYPFNDPYRDRSLYSSKTVVRKVLYCIDCQECFIDYGFNQECKCKNISIDRSFDPPDIKFRLKENKIIDIMPDPVMDFSLNINSSIASKRLIIENPKTLILSLEVPLEGFIDLQGNSRITSSITWSNDYSSKLKECYDNLDNLAVNKSIEALSN